LDQVLVREARERAVFDLRLHDVSSLFPALVPPIHARRARFPASGRDLPLTGCVNTLRRPVTWSRPGTWTRPDRTWPGSSSQPRSVVAAPPGTPGRGAAGFSPDA